MVDHEVCWEDFERHFSLLVGEKFPIIWFNTGY